MSGLFGNDAPIQVSLKSQIACVEREIRMRQSAYPRWMENGRMTEQKAYAEIATMQAVLETLRKLK